MEGRRHIKTRSAGGISLVELMATCVIMSLMGSGIAELLILNSMTNMKLSNKVDNLNVARNAIERMSKVIRMGRNVGDIYGNFNGYFFQGTNNFPDNVNPLYPSFLTPPGGWPSSTTPSWPAEPYTLSPQSLIVQVPVFDANGFPTRIQTGQGNPAATQAEDNVDTYVYQVLADPGNPGQYILQIAGFPGLSSSMTMVADPPVTLVKGIIGPLDPVTQTPIVFQYLDKTDPTGTPQNTGSGASNANVTGVLITMEIQNSEYASGEAPSVVAIKTEAYLRNNALSTVQANP